MLWITLKDPYDYAGDSVCVFVDIRDAIKDLVGEDLAVMLLQDSSAKDLQPKIVSRLSCYRSVHLFEVAVSHRICGPLSDEKFWSETLPRLLDTSEGRIPSRKT